MGGLAFIVLVTILLFYWRKNYKQWKATRTSGDNEGKENERPIPYDLKHVSAHVDQPMLHPPEPISTPPITKLSLHEKHTYSPGQWLRSLQNSPSVFLSGPSSPNEPNTSNTSHATHPRSRAFSESSLTRVPSTNSESTLTARQLNIRSEADQLRMQLSAIQQSQQTLLSQNNNSELQSIKNTLTAVVAHMQRLDRQFDSDWARGLTDEAPPEYYDARR